MEQNFVSLDVGGTSIKAGVVQGTAQGLSLIEESLHSYPSHSEQGQDVILDTLAEVIEKTASFTEPLHGVAFGFPGPFDDIQGISYMKGLGKFEAIYGTPIVPLLKKRLQERDSRPWERIPFSFVNDAWAFALGEARYGAAARYNRVFCLTLGTGCGSAFLEHGQLIQGRDGVPMNGMIFDQPFRDGKVDDYISRRYLLQCAREKGLHLDGKELFREACNGNTEAEEVFQSYGSVLGQAIRPFVLSFQPDVLLLGGRISQSISFFEGALQEELPLDHLPPVICSKNLSRSALLGAAGHWLDQFAI